MHYEYVTEGIDINNIAKCHRPLRDSSLVLPVLDSEGAAFAGTVDMTSALHGSVRLTQLRGQRVEAERQDISGLFPEVRVLVTTRGERFGDQPRCDDRRVLTLDCRCFSDPDGGLLRSHIGTHLGVIDGIIRFSSKAVQEIAETAMNFVNERWLSFRFTVPLRILLSSKCPFTFTTCSKERPNHSKFTKSS